MAWEWGGGGGGGGGAGAGVYFIDTTSFELNGLFECLAAEDIQEFPDVLILEPTRSATTDSDFSPAIYSALARDKLKAQSTCLGLCTYFYRIPCTSTT